MSAALGGGLLDELLAESGPLVGGALAAWMLKKTHSNFHKYRERTGFPRPVAQLSGGPLWRRSDIDAWERGRRNFSHEESELQSEVLESSAIARLVGLPADQVRTRVYEERWDFVPRPAGKAGRRLYWMRNEVERWANGRASR